MLSSAVATSHMWLLKFKFKLIKTCKHYVLKIKLSLVDF